MQRILDFLNENPIFYFATVDGYCPRIRPCNFYMLYNGKLYFGMGKHKTSYKQMLKNPNIEVCTSSASGQWIRIRGVAQFDNTELALKAAFENTPELKNKYNNETKQVFGLIYLDYAKVEMTDADGNFIQIDL